MATFLKLCYAGDIVLIAVPCVPYAFCQVPELSLRDRFTFAMAPVNIRDPRVLSALLEFATVYGR